MVLQTDDFGLKHSQLQLQASTIYKKISHSYTPDPLHREEKRGKREEREGKMRKEKRWVRDGAREHFSTWIFILSADNDQPTALDTNTVTIFTVILQYSELLWTLASRWITIDTMNL